MKMIKANEVRVGDSIRTSTSINGIKTTRELQVSTIEDFGRTLAFETKEFGETFVSEDADVELVNRPAPKLPTKPGSLVYVEKFQGEKVDPPILAILASAGDWVAGGRLPNGADWTPPGKITEWSEATVAKATP
ncbi:MAG: hypothetical protein L0G87_16855 [Renibacterium salmoninarum]|nr:hypothetical protein [Renibacterium salmoninarum]